MDVSRRWFIGGMASLGALQGCRAFTDPLGVCRGRGNLRFGVLSDVHVSLAYDPGHVSDPVAFIHALQWFDAQGVDAVVIAGDMAENGVDEQLFLVGNAWRKVFPGDRGADGRHVEKLFVCGNHEFGGLRFTRWHWCPYAQIPDAEIIPRMILTDPARAWEKAFDEPYEPIWKKNVKGYDFIGAHWTMEDCKGYDETFNPGIRAWYAVNGPDLDPSKPFFHIQHPHPKGTVYGDWAWGRDDGESTKALSRYPNAVAFSGHSHYSLLDERSIWQGAFTSIGTGSLRYVGLPGDASKPGYEKDRTISRYAVRSGHLVDVFDDRMVVRRRDFAADCDLGPDWVVPLGAAAKKPFSFDERARRAAPPQFPSGARVTASVGETLGVAFTAATRTFESRPWRYEVRVERGDGTVLLTKRVLSPDFHLPLANAATRITLSIPFSELPSEGRFRIVVTPCDCFGNAGESISGEEVSYV